MNQLKSIRKTVIFILIITAILGLSACGSAEKTPYGNLTDNTYASLNNLKVTEKELYNELRLQSTQVLSNLIDDIIFAKYITDAKTKLQANDEDLVLFLDETVNQQIHGSKDEEKLNDLFEKDYNRYYRNIEKFADTMFLLNNSYDINHIVSSLINMESPFENYHEIDFIIKEFIIRLAQREYAKEKLAIDVKDEDNSNYIKESNIVSYYKANKQGHYDVDALVIRFINLNEANAAVYSESIKSDSKGLWYKIPDIRIAKGEEGYVNLDKNAEDPVNEYVLSILEKLELLTKLGENYENRHLLSREDFESYYKEYTINTSRDENRDVALTTEQVKEHFVNIYNLLNPATQVEISGNTIIGKDGGTYSPTLTYDDISKIHSSLRSHLYSTLIAESAMEDPNDITEGQPYSARFLQFGAPYYLAFKLKDEKANEEGVLIEDPEDSEKEIFSSTAQDLKAEMLEELIKSKLTSSYISSAVESFYKDQSIDIYDYVIRALYEQSYNYTGTTKTQAGNVVAKINDTEITVQELFDTLEKAYGANIALDILANKYLLNQNTYSITDKDRKNYQTQFEEIISQFSANNFAQSGFPASIGREKFLLLAFGARTNQEAINQVYVLPELRSQYLKDYETHYGNGIYEKLSELTKLQYDNFKSLNVSHLLIYFDEDGNGSPEDPSDYLNKLDAQAQVRILEGLVDFVKLLYDKVGYYSTFENGLKALAEEFNNSGRILRGNDIPPVNPEDPKLDIQPELTWSKYRQLGFYLKYETLSSPVTNSSNFESSSSRLDEVFYNRVINMYEEEPTLPKLDLFDKNITAEALEEVKSAFGWHLILNTNVTEINSAKFLASQDRNGRYVSESDPTLNAYNEDTEYLSASQIKYYLIESETDEGVDLPTVLRTTFSQQFNPVFKIYSSSYMQKELVFKLLEGTTFTKTNNIFDTIREINKRQMSEYMLSEKGIYNENYADLYGEWFTILNK